MKALVIILLAVAAASFIINFIWSKALEEREAKLKKDYESYRKDVYVINKRQAELDKMKEDLHTEWMQLEGQKDYYALMEKAYKELKAEKEAKKTKKK